jgi:hypothetical protein
MNIILLDHCSPNEDGTYQDCSFLANQPRGVYVTFAESRSWNTYEDMWQIAYSGPLLPDPEFDGWIANLVAPMIAAVIPEQIPPEAIKLVREGME